MDWRHLDELLAAGREADARLENLCVWVKDNAGMGSLYRSLTPSIEQGPDGNFYVASVTDNAIYEISRKP
jgi:hypothetical protein